MFVGEISTFIICECSLDSKCYSFVLCYPYFSSKFIVIYLYLSFHTIMRATVPSDLKFVALGFSALLLTYLKYMTALVGIAKQEMTVLSPISTIINQMSNLPAPFTLILFMRQLFFVYYYITY